MGYEIASLASLIEEYIVQEGSLDDLQRVFSSFSCVKNADEEDFLLNKAINFEQRNKARTYLVMDEKGIAAYFSVAIKTIDLSMAIKTIDLSMVKLNKKKDVLAGEIANSYSAFLIGHIAKHDRVTEPLGKFILDNAIGLLLRAQKIVGGRLVYLDCKDIESLKALYENYGFKYFQTSPDTNLLQYYKKL